ncbi:choice-of-anchor L domain-containing protein [Formosa undariae]|uniref:Choice-of-anchor L domain-containing protein n=1 Tax=Formosa undariae TaxID=1325436 RepID=A0ABV5F0R5_9FLAO
MKLTLYITCLFVFLCNGMFAQIISVTPSNDAESLINTNLLSGNGIVICNPNSPKNASVSGESFSSYGSFERRANNFPLANGIFLTTGNADEAGNSSVDELNSGSTSWLGDSELEAQLGISNTVNATVLEFDFVALTETISFDYVLASQEYEKDHTICDYADGFAILIQKEGETVFKNIAVIPNTNTSVSTKEINGTSCSNYIEYYENTVSQIESTNFDGRTKTLTATHTIEPYKKYKIKFIVADQKDVNFDTAVFIKQSEVNIDVDLGNNISTCSDVELTPNLYSNLDVDLTNLNSFDKEVVYTWYKDGAYISSNPTFTATIAGNYSVDIKVYEPDCIDGQSATNVFTISDDITIDYIPNQTIALDPKNANAELERCSSITEQFILDEFNNYIKDQIPNNANSYNIKYYRNGNNITEIDIAPGNTETITAIATRTSTACAYTFDFPLSVNKIPNPQPQIITRCDNDLEFNLEAYSNLFNSGNTTDFTVTYHYTQYQAEQGSQPIASPYIGNRTQLYVRVINNNTECAGTTTLTLDETESIELFNASSTVISGCTYTPGGGITTAELDIATDELLNGQDPNQLIISYFGYEEDATQNINKLQGANLDAYLDNQPTIIFIRVEPLGGGCPAIAKIDIYPTISINFSAIENYAVCGGTSFNLIQIANDIKSKIQNLTVTFYDGNPSSSTSSEIAQIADYTIPDLDGDGVEDDSQTIYVKVEDPDCGQISTSFQIFKAPGIIYRDRPFLPLICYNDRVIDLKTYKDLIIDNSNEDNIQIQYYLTADNRDLDENELPIDYLDHTDIINGILYARVTKIGVTDGILIGNCFDAIDIVIDVVDMPQVHLTYTDFQYCVTNPELEVTLDFVETELVDIINNDAANAHIAPEAIDIKFYENLSDAEAGNSNFLDPNVYTTTTKTIYSRVTNKKDTSICPVIDPINIAVFLQPEFNKTEFFECDIEVVPVRNIDLYQLFNHYIASEIEVTFYDADDNPYTINSEISVPYDQTITIYAIARNKNNTLCDNPVKQAITLRTGQTPAPIPFDLSVCVVPGQAYTEINLDDVEAELESLTGVPLVVSFYENKAEAEASLNSFILKTNSYQISANQAKHNLFVQIKNPGTECYIVQTLLIKINDTPNFKSSSIASVCSPDYVGNNMLFNLEETTLDLTLKTGYNAPVIYFFEDIDDANSLNISNQITNSLEADQTYVKPVGINTIYVVAKDPDTDCFEVRALDLVVNYPSPTKDLTDFEFCDDGSGTLFLKEIDNRLVYDLNSSEITYYKTDADADAATNPLSDIYNYKTPINGTEIHARVSSIATGCYIIKPITLQPNSNGTALNLTANASFFQNSNTITVDVIGGTGNYVYSLDHGDFQTSNIFTDVNIGSHTVFVSNDLGCSEGITTVTVVDIPKFFTPNQDGYNDTWHIIGIEDLAEAEVQIFNRFGKLLAVLNKNNNPTFEDGWNGLSNGAPMPTDDYWYVARIKNGTEDFERSGHFTLKR